MIRIVFAFLLLLAGPLYAQQASDNEFFRRAIAPLQQQRNAAMDDAVNLRAQLDKAVEDLSKAQARIKELEDKLPKEAKKDGEAPK